MDEGVESIAFDIHFLGNDARDRSQIGFRLFIATSDDRVGAVGGEILVKRLDERLAELVLAAFGAAFWIARLAWLPKVLRQLLIF